LENIVYKKIHDIAIFLMIKTYYEENKLELKEKNDDFAINCIRITSRLNKRFNFSQDTLIAYSIDKVIHDAICPKYEKMTVNFSIKKENLLSNYLDVYHLSMHDIIIEKEIDEEKDLVNFFNWLLFNQGVFEFGSIYSTKMFGKDFLATEDMLVNANGLHSYHITGIYVYLGKSYLIAKNSHGNTFGDEGYFYIPIEILFKLKEREFVYTLSYLGVKREEGELSLERWKNNLSEVFPLKNYPIKK
jgi:hypothetical protein